VIWWEFVSLLWDYNGENGHKKLVAYRIPFQTKREFVHKIRLGLIVFKWYHFGDI